MELEVGLRVVRGPDWSWGDQDGGEGHVGTVVEVGQDGRSVLVQWDCGNRCRYRCGEEGKYDLRLLDSAPAGVVHPSITCDVCGQDQVVHGMRWKCARCYDYDLCTPCYMSGKHSVEHEFVRYDSVGNRRYRTRIQQRSNAELLEVKGIFPGAEVVQQPDWQLEGSKGAVGEVGKVISIHGSEGSKFQRSMAKVLWKDKEGMYKVGHSGKKGWDAGGKWVHPNKDNYKGLSSGKRLDVRPTCPPRILQVELKCTVAASGGSYYPNHLPSLGAPHTSSEPPGFSVGDYVRVVVDEETLKTMQEGHGGWDDLMSRCGRKLGLVWSVLESGDLQVKYGKITWSMNPKAFIKVDIPPYASGDVVRITEDIAKAIVLQEDHGGLDDEMAETLGRFGRVVQVNNNDGVVLVRVKGRVWAYSPLCLAPTSELPADILTDYELPGEGIDAELCMKLQSLLEEEKPEVLANAAMLGDVPTIREYLQKYPNEVNAKLRGMAPIHYAVAARKDFVLKALLEFNANVEIEDATGQRPLHLCAKGSGEETATLLLDAGANPNSESHYGATPLTVAARGGNPGVLAVLASHPDTKLNSQNSDGDTALHCAVYARRAGCIHILMNAGADPTLVNFKLLTPIHLASQIGFIGAMEQFVIRFPQHADIKDDDGNTPLHVASALGHRDIVTLLVDLESCNINARNRLLHTPLHLAILKGHSRVVERLVCYGADLTAIDQDGNTPLHLLLAGHGMEQLSADTPLLNRICNTINQQMGIPNASEVVVVACFLIEKGADIYSKNKRGQTPFQLCPPLTLELLSTFATRYARRAENSEGPEEEDQSANGSKLPAPHDAASPTPQVHVAHSGNEPGDMGHDSPVPGLCFLCDTPITVKFHPCGHAVLCEHCSKRAKKCLECKTPVQDLVQL